MVGWGEGGACVFQCQYVCISCAEKDKLWSPPRAKGVKVVWPEGEMGWEVGGRGGKKWEYNLLVVRFGFYLYAI